MSFFRQIFSTIEIPKFLAISILFGLAIFPKFSHAVDVECTTNPCTYELFRSNYPISDEAKKSLTGTDTDLLCKQFVSAINAGVSIRKFSYCGQVFGSCIAKAVPGTCDPVNISSGGAEEVGLFFPITQPSYTCQQVINKSVSTPLISPNRTRIEATFTPNFNLSLAEAAKICKVTAFDWQQTFTNLPLPSPYYARSNPRVPLSAPPAFNDPPPGGYSYQPNIDNSYPFYYDPKNGELLTHQINNTLTYFDNPSNPCLPGSQNSTTAAFADANCGGRGKRAPVGSYNGFTTHLAGVLPDGSALDFGIGFTWKSTFNGTSGGVAMTKSDVPTDPGSGSGGITITGIQDTTDYDPNMSPPTVKTLGSDNLCNGVFGGLYNGDINVEKGQSCTFINGRITGDIHQNGGNLVLINTLVKENVHIHKASTFSIGPSVTIKGNLHVENVPAGVALNNICGVTVNGNFAFKHNGSAVQIGAASPMVCDGNIIVGKFTIDDNTGAISIFGNSVTEHMRIENNLGATTVSNNTVVEHLHCEDNRTITGAGNTARKKIGQCSSF